MKKIAIVLSFFFYLPLMAQFSSEDFDINGNGKPISQEKLNSWFMACKANAKEIHFSAGVFCLPKNFQYDFGDFDLSITGVRGKTIITTYDSTSATNFEIAAKLDITKYKPADGIYQIDITGLPFHSIQGKENSNVNGRINSDFKDLPDKSLDAYVRITNGTISNISLTEVKGLGYLTELNTSAPDPGIDGLYVVAKHINFSYGGGFAHLNLKYANAISGSLSNYNTGGKNVFYLQGTVLQRKNGIWSRHYTGAGFGTKKNLVVKDMIFDNVQFYIFSPFDLSRKATCKTSDKFSIDNCVFKNCSRVLSSATYAGIDQDTSWFKMSSVYDTWGQFRFNNFSITNCDFSYIHEAIVWGPPPSKSTRISGNNIHDCYTILTAFYLLMTRNSPDYWTGRITQVITDNSFIDVRPLNNGANATTSIIRTGGSATVNNNCFLNITQQAVYISGSGSTFNGNTVIKFIDDAPDYTTSPVILCKLVLGQGDVIVSGNTIISPLSSLVSVEGGASFVISNNTYTGCLKIRHISSNTAALSTDRIYVVQNLHAFQKLAGADTDSPIYDPAIQKSDRIYFNKRTGIWEKLYAHIPDTHVFSKNNDFSETNQYVKITGNIIESENITNISSGRKNILFRSVNVSNNDIFCSMLHTGNQTTVGEYVCSGNDFRGSINIATVSSLTKQIKSLFFENNRIAKNFAGSISLWAYQDLIFKGNIIFEDENWKPSTMYDEFGLNASQLKYGVILKGAPGSKIVVENNRFVTAQSSPGALTIEDPYDAEIKNNSFDLKTASYQMLPDEFHNAVYIKGSNDINMLLFTGNSIYPEQGKKNNIIRFDESPGTISSLLIDGNKVPVNQSDITNTILGENKTINLYSRGVNFYPQVSEKLKLVKKTR